MKFGLMFLSLLVTSSASMAHAWGISEIHCGVAKSPWFSTSLQLLDKVGSEDSSLASKSGIYNAKIQTLTGPRLLGAMVEGQVTVYSYMTRIGMKTSYVAQLPDRSKIELELIQNPVVSVSDISFFGGVLVSADGSELGLKCK
jgi:hypothetical protein